MDKIGSGIRRGSLGSRLMRARLVLDCFVDFTTMNRNVLGSLDAKSDLVTANLNDGHRDVVVDNDAFVLLAGENQHRRSSLVPIALGAYRPLLGATLGPR